MMSGAGGPAHRLVRRADRGWQLDVGPCVDLRKTTTPKNRHLDPRALPSWAYA